ncbi:MAG: hypothetical protein OEY79_00135 [Anaplasmataceae bacterium]|nr:hypothetical protein [Anaplasmataceae bacterium]
MTQINRQLFSEEQQQYIVFTVRKELDNYELTKVADKREVNINQSIKNLDEKLEKLDKNLNEKIEKLDKKVDEVKKDLKEDIKDVKGDIRAIRNLIFTLIVMGILVPVILPMIQKFFGI